MMDVSPSIEPSLPIGGRVGGLVIDAVLSSSEYGFVYQASDPLLMRRIALKEHFPSHLYRREPGGAAVAREDADPKTLAAGRQAFFEEARLLARLQVPGLLGVQGLLEDHQTVYRMMPLYAGQSLAERRNGSAPSPSEAQLLQWLTGLLEPLAVLHANGLVHGYVQPGQVMVSDDGPPLLLGFGTVRRALHGPLDADYAPLEQSALGGQLPRGAWTDLYAVAALARFALTGNARGAVPTLSPRVAQAVEWASAEQPAQRPQSAEAFRLALLGEPDEVVAAAPVTPPVASAEPAPMTPAARTATGTRAPVPPAPTPPGFTAASAPAAGHGSNAALHDGGDPSDENVRAAIASMLEGLPPAPPRRQRVPMDTPSAGPSTFASHGGESREPMFDLGGFSFEPPRRPGPPPAPPRGAAWPVAAGIFALAVVAGVVWQWPRVEAAIVEASGGRAPSARLSPDGRANDELRTAQTAAPAAPASPSFSASGASTGTLHGDLQQLPPPAAGLPSAVPPPPLPATLPDPDATPSPAPAPATGTSPSGAQRLPQVDDGEEILPSNRPSGDAERAGRTPAMPINPRLACAGRTNFSLEYCMQNVCRRAEYSAHPECRAIRDNS